MTRDSFVFELDLDLVSQIAVDIHAALEPHEEKLREGRAAEVVHMHLIAALSASLTDLTIATVEHYKTPGPVVTTVIAAGRDLGASVAAATIAREHDAGFTAATNGEA